ncbi:GDP-L-fucose synthase [Mesorhizobium sp. M0959]|uniref:GDP-L-fucose synthase family protein n=1 Tax=Mesorhizobium sp. M0959 TaxID=2957034 RepID=UPI003337107F
MGREIFSLDGKRVWVAGHRGMVGQALTQCLRQEGCHLVSTGTQRVDLRRQQDVEQCLEQMRPHVIFLAAARVGGILANASFPATFLYDNLIIAANVMEAARVQGVEKLLFLGSSCIYPRMAPQPIPEEALLSGPLEPTNEWYALAKIAGIKMAQAFRRQYRADFISVQPANLYGPGDNFHPLHSHVPAAPVRRFHEAKVEGRTSVTVWGTGAAKREFLYLDDLADACVFLMKRYSDDLPINVGTGEDITIADFAEAVAQTVGFKGRICFDSSKPDGAPRKLVDVGRMAALGWRARTGLRQGLKRFYEAHLAAEGGSGARSAPVGVEIATTAE